VKKHRITLDVLHGGIYARDVDAIEIEPGELVYRDSDRALRPFATDCGFSGERYIVSAWHDTEESARVEAVAELDRRINAMRRLVERCLAGDITGGKA
jgi:hypothetical protein